MTKTAPCPHCHATNAFNVATCLECRQPLPWGDAVLAFQSQIGAARAAATQAQQQAQQVQQQYQRAQTAQSINQAQAFLSSGAANSNVPPGQVLSVNPFHVFADAFVGRFADALEDLDKASAAWFGMVCAFLYNVCLVVGVYLIVQNTMQSLALLFPSLNFVPPVPGSATPSTTPTPENTPGLSAAQVGKLIVVALTPWLAIAASCTLARKVFGGEERHLEGDVFIAGVTLLPLGLFVLAMGVLGIQNIEVTGVLAVFTLTYSILLLYRGLTTVSAVRDMAAAICVPLVMLLSGWLTKIVLSRLTTL